MQIEDTRKKKPQEMTLTEIPEGTVFTGRIQSYEYSPWYRTRYAVVSLVEPAWSWQLPDAGNAKVYDYEPRTATLVLQW